MLRSPIWTHIQLM